VLISKQTREPLAQNNARGLLLGNRTNLATRLGTAAQREPADAFAANERSADRAQRPQLGKQDVAPLHQHRGVPAAGMDAMR
jgi:hypothetical protein